MKKDDVVITQGDDGDNFYVVASGTCNCYVGSRDETGLVCVCQPGDGYGELSLMYNAPRAASVIAMTDVSLWALDRNSFTVLLVRSAMAKRMAHEHTLEFTPIFASLGAYDRMSLADAISAINYAGGTKIIEQGGEPDAFFVISEGKVVVTQTPESGGEAVEIVSLKRGDYFGEVGIMKEQPRVATVTAVGDVTCVLIPVAAFRKGAPPSQLTCGACMVSTPTHWRRLQCSANWGQHCGSEWRSHTACYRRGLPARTGCTNNDAAMA